MSGVIQICLCVWVDMFCVCLVYGKSSVIGLCVVIMWGVVGGGLIVVCTTHYTPHNNHTQPDHTRFTINLTNTEQVDPHR